jgi:hypothetical protein
MTYTYFPLQVDTQFLSTPPMLQSTTVVHRHFVLCVPLNFRVRIGLITYATRRHSDECRIFVSILPHVLPIHNDIAYLLPPV